MDQLKIYIQLGYEHISDLTAYDHILFLLTITTIYTVWNLKGVFIAVTGFTLGHSLTLALTTLKVIELKAEIIEFLIPLTIMISAISTSYKAKKHNYLPNNTSQFILTLLFGLIHGMAFSNQLNSLMSGSDLFLPLLGFNLGVELGQLLIVAVILLLTTIIEQVFNISKRTWVNFSSGIAFGLALLLASENKFW